MPPPKKPKKNACRRRTGIRSKPVNATNHFRASLVACARALSFDPWNGIALYHVGLAQIQTGRFEDALATFTQADRFDTPQVSRWTWMIGAAG